MALIEPNVHPIFVHFAVGLLFTAAILLAVTAFAPAQAGWRDSLGRAGDWMLLLGLAALAGAAAAGFQAFYSVAHDGPSHEAMITHRNWALATAAVFLIAGIWRWTGRSGAPSIPSALALLVAAGLLTVTAWWGGRLVFHHGLGVAGLPQATGEGHDHDHGGQEHATADDGHEAADSGDHAAHDNGASPGAKEVVREAPPAVGNDSPEAVADAFHDALVAGDEAAVRRLLAPDVLILESGGAERSLEEYAAHHMAADMAFMAAVEARRLSRASGTLGDTAWVATERAVTGRYKGKDLALKSQETLVLHRGEDGEWRIVHVHWSSGPLPETQPQPEPKAEAGGDGGHDDGHEHDHSDHDH